MEFRMVDKKGFVRSWEADLEERRKREIDESSLELSLLPSLSESVDCSVVILYLTANIHLKFLEISPLSVVELVKLFSHSVGCCFVLWMVSFALQKLFSFMRSHLLIVDLSVCAIDVMFWKLSLVPVHSKLFLTFSSIKFSMSGFMLRSLIHLDLSFV
ncbi:hypothetical protein STEG23_008824 [Scotinomys teguina]